DAYELILPPGNAGLIDYDHHEYARLPQEEKNKITAFIKFIVSQNQ
ncbi:XRE family transcriptional regulator, partial [Klebsiella pneumoniae]